MGGIGQNLQLQSDGSEIVCAVRAPCKNLCLQNCVTKYVIFCELWKKMSVPDIRILGLTILKVNQFASTVSRHKKGHTLFFVQYISENLTGYCISTQN